MSNTVIYDACVLYPASLRSFLMWLGYHALVHPRWTERILDECFGNLLQNRPDLEPKDLERTRRLMCEAIPDCLVTGYESRIEEISLPDRDDRHVVAAALEADADIIVTFNLRDFPRERLAPYGIRAVEPDDFVRPLVESDPETIWRCLEDEASIRTNPERSIDEIIDSLAARGLEQAAEAMADLQISE